MRTLSLLLVLLFILTKISYAQDIYDHYKITDLRINRKNLKSLVLIKLNEEVSSVNYNKYESLLVPQEELQPRARTLFPGIREALKQRNRRNNPKVLCFYLKDIKGALLCLFDNQKVLEAILGNTMLFAWTDLKPADRPFHRFAPRKYRFEGADLRAEDLKNRSNVIKNTSRAGSLIERTFYSKIIEPEIKKHGDNFSLIAAHFLCGDKCWDKGRNDDVVAHEALHAKYFLDKTFRKAVDDYFDPIFTSKNHQHHSLVTCIQRALHQTGVYPGIYQNELKRNTELANVFLQISVNTSFLAEVCGHNTNNPIAIELYDKIISSGAKMPDIYNSLYEKKPARPPHANLKNEYYLFYSDRNTFRPDNACLRSEIISVRSITR